MQCHQHIPVWGVVLLFMLMANASLVSFADRVATTMAQTALRVKLVVMNSKDEYEYCFNDKQDLCTTFHKSYLQQITQ